MTPAAIAANFSLIFQVKYFLKAKSSKQGLLLKSTSALGFANESKLKQTLSIYGINNSV